MNRQQSDSTANGADIARAAKAYQQGDEGFYVVNQQTDRAVAGPFLTGDAARVSAEGRNATPPETPGLLVVVRQYVNQFGRVDREMGEKDRTADRLRLAEAIIHQAEGVAKNGGDPTNILRSYAYFGESCR